MNSEKRILIAESTADRLDSYLAEQTEFSRSKLAKLIKEGEVCVNGKTAKPNTEVRLGDTIVLSVPADAEIAVEPEPMQLDIVYEDEDLLVVNKPKGLVVHPAPGNPNGTLVNGLLYHFHQLSSVGGTLRPGIVHRIDRDTSGLLVIAKNDFTHESLARQFSDHSAHRSYVCLVHGNFKEDDGTVDAPIGRHPIDRKRMAVVSDGKHAVTHWKVLHRFAVATFLHVTLETGRTHQIRVHMAHVKHPIMGDPVYGSVAPKLHLHSQALHGFRLEFIHPRTRLPMCFRAPLPDDFTHALQLLGLSEIPEF